ncbi:hypothetical protein KKA15_06060 [Patescibacteria group bacterium]|nr:hypothetical protein [Patescibacteria group bacterium]
MQYNRELIKNIFYSNRDFDADMQLIVNICYLLNNGLLTFKKEKISTKEIFDDYSDDLIGGKILKADIDGGECRHLSLKLISKDYLAKQGITDIKIEYEFDGYIPDIISSNKKIIIECGDTNPDKIFNYFKNKNLEKVIIVTYPNIDDTDIYAYTFIPNEELSDFLVFKDKQEFINIKRIINRKK